MKVEFLRPIMWGMSLSQTCIEEAPQTKQGKDKAFAANFLGVSVATINRMIVEKRGPKYKKIGNLVRFSEDDLRDYWDNLPGGGSTQAA